jgi:hypothetical protein
MANSPRGFHTKTALLTYAPTIKLLFLRILTPQYHYKVFVLPTLRRNGEKRLLNSTKETIQLNSMLRKAWQGIIGMLDCQAANRNYQQEKIWQYNMEWQCTLTTATMLHSLLSAGLTDLEVSHEEPRRKGGRMLFVKNAYKLPQVLLKSTNNITVYLQHNE